MKKWLVAGLVVLLIFLAAFSAGAEESFSLWATPKEGEVTSRLYKKADGKSDVVDKVPYGQRLKVTGTKGNFYQVEWQGKTVYASFLRWQLVGELPAGAEQMPLTKAQQAVGLKSHIFTAGNRRTLPLQGNVTLSQPTSYLCLYIYDCWQMRMEKCLISTLKKPTNELNLADYVNQFNIKEILAGWKKLYITAFDGKEHQLIGRTEFYMMGKGNAPDTINSHCTMPNKKELSDRKLSTGWTSKKNNKTLSISLPTDRTAALMTLEWQKPVSFRCTQKDSEGQLIARQEYNTGFYLDSVQLDSNTRQIEITILSEKATLANLNLYAPGYSELVVQQWQPMPNNLDIMFISTHQDDEMLFFGGGIPYYAASDHATGVVYVINCGRSRYQEALDGLWTAGLKNHPIFMQYEDAYSSSLEQAKKNCDWKALLKDLVMYIRKYRPKVIVTHDFKGEYGHGQHRMTAALVAEALPLAADPAYDKASAAEYGTWQVQKLYIHLYEKQQIIMDWTQPIREGSVATPILLATAGYNRHFSQLGDFSMEKHGVMYDNRKFGLYYSAVGPDEACNDFMEHVE